MFAANPQGLQQRYAMNQDLLDLLALQKLKKDKEAAQRSLQMQMQPESGTVKDQLEGQMMQATKQELASSLAPGLQQQGQAMQAQQMQKAMAGGLPTQPAPNMVGMARGGIVGYAPGGDVEGEEDPLDYAQVDPQMAGLRSDSLLKGLVEFFARKNAEAERYRRTGSTEQPPSYTPEVGPPIDAPSLPVDYKFTPRQPAEEGIASVLPQRDVDRRAYTDEENEANEANVAMATETLPAMQQVQREAPQDPRMSRYEAQLARLEAEETDKLGALIAFLQGAGASGGTNLGATLMGGGSGIQVRDARIRDEMTQTLKNIETLQLEREKMGQQESQFTREQDFTRSENQRDRESREREARAAADAAIAKAQFEFDQYADEAERELNGLAAEIAMQDPEFITARKEITEKYAGGFFSDANPGQAQAEISALYRTYFSRAKRQLNPGTEAGGFSGDYITP
jgi:hypothetical protein